MEAITREEQFLAAIAEGDSSGMVPVTREEMYLAYIAGQNIVPPEPITRKEKFLSRIPQTGSGGGSGVTIRNQNKTITKNGSYKADSGYTGLGTVTVNVPEREPVLEPLTVTENGTYNPGSGVDGFSPVTVNVASAGGGGYTLEDIAQPGNITGDLVIDFPIKRSYAFANLTEIKKVTLKAGYAGSYATANVGFFNGSSVTEIYVEPGAQVQAGHNGMFANCKQLTKAVLNECNCGSSMFENCSALEYIDINATPFSSDKSFQNCTNLKILILRYPSVLGLHAPTYWAFPLNGTPFDNDPAGSGGFCLVPSTLVSEYQIATNWSVLYEVGTCTFLPLEEYTVDGTTTGEINWDKLNAVVYPS